MDATLPWASPGAPSFRTALHTPQDWPGGAAPVLAVVDDSLASVAAARWASRSAAHRGVEVALLVILPSSFDVPPPAALDDARAVVGRVLPTVARAGAVAHAIVAPVPVSAAERNLMRCAAHAVSDAARGLGAPLVVAPCHWDSGLGRELLRTVDADMLLVPSLQSRRALAVGS